MKKSSKPLCLKEIIIGNDCKHTISIVNVLLDAALRQLDDGDWMIEVTMIETGEKAEYRWTHLSDDPEAH